MSPVQNVWRQLVQRRLWPVAILLAAALAAVPVMLAKDPEPTVAPPAPVADTSKDELATQPIVSLAEASASSKHKKVLGDAKNPFRVDPPKEEEQPAAEQPNTDPGSTGGTPGGAGGSGSGDGAVTPPATGVPGAPVEPAAPAPKKKEYEPYELTVRFGGEDTKRESVRRLEPLPSAELPVLIYTGVLKNGKVAEFLLDAGVTAVGDGECHPSPDACETIRLREGETQFLDVKDEAGNVVAGYQLDLIKIHKGNGASASKAKAAKAAKARNSRAELRSVAGRVSSYLP